MLLVKISICPVCEINIVLPGPHNPPDEEEMMLAPVECGHALHSSCLFHFVKDTNIKAQLKRMHLDPKLSLPLSKSEEPLLTPSVNLEDRTASHSPIIPCPVPGCKQIINVMKTKRLMPSVGKLRGVPVPLTETENALLNELNRNDRILSQLQLEKQNLQTDYTRIKEEIDCIRINKEIEIASAKADLYRRADEEISKILQNENIP